MLSYNDFHSVKSHDIAISSIIGELKPCIDLFPESSKSAIEAWLVNVMEEIHLYEIFEGYYYGLITPKLNEKLYKLYVVEKDLILDSREEEALLALGRVAYFLYFSSSFLLDEDDQKCIKAIELPKEILNFKLDFNIVDNWIRNVVIKVQEDFPTIKLADLQELFKSGEDDFLVFLAWSSFRYVTGNRSNSRYFRKIFVDLINKEILSKKLDIRSWQLKDAVNNALGNISCFYDDGRKKEQLFGKKKNIKTYIKEIDGNLSV